MFDGFQLHVEPVITNVVTAQHVSEFLPESASWEEWTNTRRYTALYFCVMVYVSNNGNRTVKCKASEMCDQQLI